MERSDTAVLLLAAAGVLLASLLLFERCSKPSKPLGPAPEEGVAALLQAPAPALGSLRELRGKAVVLEFWATWCGVCRETLPHMNKMRERFAGKPVVFISVTKEGRAAVEPFLKAHPMTGWIGLDEDGAAFEAFRVRGLPYIVVLDAEGRVLGETYPDQLTAERLEAMLQAQAPKP